MVEDIVECLALRRLPAEEFQVVDGEAVKPHVFIFFDTAKVLNMTRLQVLRHIQIVENTPRSNHSVGHLVQSETFQVLHLPLFLQSLMCRLCREHPVL